VAPRQGRRHVARDLRGGAMTTGPAAAPAPEASPRKASLGTLFFTVFLDLLGFGLVIPFLPGLARDLGAGDFVATMPGAAYSLMQFLFIPVWGRLSDRVGRRPVLLASSVALLVLSYPFFLLMRHGGLAGAILSTIGLGVILAMILGTHAVAVAEIFPTRVRQGALSIGYNAMAAVFAGTVPYLLTFWINRTHDLNAPALYLVIVAVVGLVATLTLRETVGRSLLTEADVAEDGAAGGAAVGTEPARSERA